MPSALETLVKILKLERDQGGNDTAVIGGLTAFAETWQTQARKQARRPVHHILVDEIHDVLTHYNDIDTSEERVEKVVYLLDRITNRIPPPQRFKNRLPYWEEQMQIDHPDKKFTPKERQSGPPTSRRESFSRNNPLNEDLEEETVSWDEDYLGGTQTLELDVKPMPTLARPPRVPRPQRTLEEEQALLNALKQSTTHVKGIGGKLAGLIEQLDLFTISDMLNNFPRDFQNYTELKNIRNLTPSDVTTVIGTVCRTDVAVGKSNRKDLIVEIEDGSGYRLAIRFFSQHYLASKLKFGKQIVVSGKVTIYREQLQMANPEWEFLDIENLHTVGIVPVYRMTKGLKPRMFRKTMKALVDEWEQQIPDPIPQTVLDRAELAGLGWSIKQAHFPDSWDHLEHARKRIIFDDLLMLQLAILGNRREWQSVAGQALDVTDDFLEAFITSVFPYELTSAQQRAIADIRRDVAQTTPMNRLIQGDVGSGKTAVATVAMAMALANGKQAALMAPTSILAEQHYRGLSETFDKMDSDQRPVVALLTGSLTTSERQSIYRGISDGSIDVVIGTHALIQDGVEFNNLAVAVIDEQHRFGVDQRGSLRSKGHHPHLLVMTATPIPRTLALTIHADLDLTVIDEKPPGRQPVDTKVIDPAARERLNGFVVAQLEQGRQAFFVHPLVEESESIDTASAVEAFERLSHVFYQYRVCLLHGRMSSTEKDTIMAEFANHEYDVMVTTSVAEVGVDVPNASVIVIDGANRFGLSQLHQFRGRVGRGSHQSYCFLLPDSNSGISLEKIKAFRRGEVHESDMSVQEKRLSAMEETNDGFRLAEMDWKLRGAGDLLGTRQSGRSKLHMVELMKPELVELAQKEARTLYEEDPDLHLPEHQLLANRINQLYNTSGDVS
jgi:ATP-dependent DNA helicase RecG